MSQDTREHLEGIAVDMVMLSIKYIGYSRAEAWEEVQELTDAELIEFITK